MLTTVYKTSPFYVKRSVKLLKHVKEIQMLIQVCASPGRGKAFQNAFSRIIVPFITSP